MRTVPPPVGGWNTRDPLDQMDAKDAILLDNWFPRENDVVMRGGHTEFAEMSATTGYVETLAELHTGAVRQLIACGSGSVRLLRAQREGKGAQEAADFVRGYPIRAREAVA